MKKQMPGRPALDHSEILRRKIWYWNVISRTKRTHYELDVTFDIHHSDRLSPLTPGKRRRKIWEDLRDKNLMPFKRELQTFLALVDRDTEFNGTAKIYNSYLWRFFSKTPMTASELRNFIVEILKNYGLFSKSTYKEQNSASEIEAILKSKFHTFENLQGYIQNLQIISNLITSEFDKLALYGALFREAYYNADLELAFYLDGVYLNKRFEIMQSGKWVPDDAVDLFDKVSESRKYAHNKAVDRSYSVILKRAAKSTPAYNLLINEQED